MILHKKIRNKFIWKNPVGMPITDIMRENRLRWNDRMHGTRPIHALVMGSELIRAADGKYY